MAGNKHCLSGIQRLSSKIIIARDESTRPILETGFLESFNRTCTGFSDSMLICTRTRYSTRCPMWKFRNGTWHERFGFRNMNCINLENCNDLVKGVCEDDIKSHNTWELVRSKKPPSIMKEKWKHWKGRFCSHWSNARYLEGYTYRFEILLALDFWFRNHRCSKCKCPEIDLLIAARLDWRIPENPSFLTW